VDKKFIAIRRLSKRHPRFWLQAVSIVGLLWWRSNYLALTDRAVIRRKGVFNKEERAVPLNQVQDISIAYGIIRRMLGHGDIRIETASTAGTEIIIKNVPHPEDFRSKVFEQIDRFYDNSQERPSAADKAKNEA